MTDKKKTVVLTIDDEQAVRAAFSDFLSGFGYKVIEAENGRDGLDQFAVEKPDIVLVDLQMPVMSGFEVLEHLRDEAPETPVVVISGTNSIDDVVDAIHLGAWDYIIKPIQSLTVLNHVIEKAIDRAHLKKQNQIYQKNLEEAHDKMKYDLEMGRNIQMKLLPNNNTTIGDFAFKRQVLPSMYLSGDFVDYFNIGDGYIGLYMADVSGHGVPSALITVFLKSFMDKHIENYHNHESDVILGPANLLEELNNELLNEGLERFITLFYGVINQNTNTLLYSNGGQYPYPILWQNSHSEILPAADPPVGMIVDRKFHEFKIVLPDSFLLALFSDGILEILPQEHMKDKTKFLVALGHHNRKDFDEFYINLNTLKTSLPDDIAILTVERGASSGSA
ncbi:MAG: fused response regulator/phosphatase [Calditrichaceae bacterium]|nr:fused response regulator/phosphatase [Calditrichaceae bacterium]